MPPVSFDPSKVFDAGFDVTKQIRLVPPFQEKKSISTFYILSR